MVLPLLIVFVVFIVFAVDAVIAARTQSRARGERRFGSVEPLACDTGLV